MAIKKKNMISKMARGLILGEIKRFKTIITKYYPDGKEKKEILKSFEEIYTRNNDYRYYLQHHGIQGQKWGVRNAEWYPIANYKAHLGRMGGNPKGSKTSARVRASEGSSIIDRVKTKLKDAKFNRDAKHVDKFNDTKKLLNSVKNYSSINLNEWGKSKDTNILYVTGSSGSGKSTIAEKLAEDGKIQVIHLDPYLGMMSQESRNLYQNKDFNKYLSKRVPEYRDVLNPDGKLNYKIVDKIAKVSEDYGKEKFGKEKVIIEGVQLFDETFYSNRDSYRNKPVLALKTNPIISDLRGSQRDSENVLETIELFAYRLPMSIKTYKTVENFEKDLELKVGKNLYKEITSTKISSYKDSDTNFKHSEQEREIAAKVKENGYSSLTEAEKKIYNKAYN